MTDQPKPPTDYIWSEQEKYARERLDEVGVSDACPMTLDAREVLLLIEGFSAYRALREENERLKDEAQHAMCVEAIEYDRMRQRAEKAEAELAEARRDAERYRFYVRLGGGFIEQVGDGTWREDDPHGMGTWWHETADAAFDAAIARHEQEGQGEPS